ncbi:uncharacterized protein YndB with AHSA1/START domain [Psychromicrobium silvestre]|uniref:Uncharacterized protein YndB with AHSA1/START domain n=1 Tax=Psychromicrobium silvestre TaxID=1645614 RepID=A0A7Y9S5X0_9MICC|nr:hypothetical protein [Psychromicrobium silvestre]NYE93802.1 uncharacterized protein YndB with AHSA1/START domain [Psychromicrobium silvestre]
MHKYSFRTDWRLPVAPERCWQELVVQHSWRLWWPALRDTDRVETPLLPGSELRLTVRSPLGYRLRVSLIVVELATNRFLKVTGSGDLQGQGRAYFRAEELPSGQQGTRLRIFWTVQTTRHWMNLLSPVAAPIFGWAHGAVMRDGERRFRRYLTTST